MGIMSHGTRDKLSLTYENWEKLDHGWFNLPTVLDTADWTVQVYGATPRQCTLLTDETVLYQELITGQNNCQQNHLNIKYKLYNLDNNKATHVDNTTTHKLQ